MKREALQRMKNVEARLQHAHFVEESRAIALEKATDRARKHSELLEQHKLAKEKRIAEHGESDNDRNRAAERIALQQNRAEQRQAAEATIQEAKQALSALLAARKQKAQ